MVVSKFYFKSIQSIENPEYIFAFEENENIHLQIRLNLKTSFNLNYL